jgi:hypothetical protein
MKTQLINKLVTLRKLHGKGVKGLDILENCMSIEALIFLIDVNEKL